MKYVVLNYNCLQVFKPGFKGFVQYPSAVDRVAELLGYDWEALLHHQGQPINDPEVLDFIESEVARTGRGWVEHDEGWS